MGTNYYLLKPESPPCKHCGRTDPEVRLHIGKQSGGWEFSFHAIEDEGIESFDDWKKKFFADATAMIVDEYGRIHEKNDFIKAIYDSKKPFEKNGTPKLNFSKEQPGKDTWLDNEGFSFYNREFS